MRWHMKIGVENPVASANIIADWTNRCLVRRIARTLDHMEIRLIGANAKRKVAMHTCGKNGKMTRRTKTMSDGERGAQIIEKLMDIVDALNVPKRKKTQIKNWLWKLYGCLDV